MPDPCGTCLDCYCECGKDDIRDWACFPYCNTACECQAPGCAVGCDVCFDNAGTATSHVDGITRTGRRWGRPARFNRRPAYMTRDAWGYVSPLLSNRTTLLTRDTVYQVAQCYDTRGGECFENAEQDGPCACSYEYNSICVEDFDCEGAGGADRFTWPDCIFYHGSGVPNSPPEIDCRRCGDAHARWVSPTFGLFEGDRLGNLAEARTRSCASNQMVACIGAVPLEGRCCDLEDSRAYYVDGQHEQLWSTFDLRWGSPSEAPHYHIPEDASPEMQVKLAIQNAALEYIRANAGSLPGDSVSSVDTLFHLLPPGGGLNQQLDRWAGVCTSVGCADRVVFELPNSHLRYSGVPIRAVVVLESVGITASFILHRIEEHQPDSIGNEMRPGGRIEIDVRLAVRCEFIGDPPEGLEWEDTGGTCSRNRIAGGLDEVVLVTSGGVNVQVPYRFAWRGGRTEWTMDQFQVDHPSDNDDFCGGGTTLSQCCRFASQLTLVNGCQGTRWRGMPSRYPAEPTTRDAAGADLQADIWLGGVNLRIPIHKFVDHCGGSCAERILQECQG